MILKIDVLISFPLGAICNANPDLYIYKKLLALMKNTLCFNGNSKCMNCPLKNECIYYKITGENFSYYPAIFLKVDNFYKTNYSNNEEKLFSFFFIGKFSYLTKYINILFEEYLNKTIFNNIFVIKEIKTSELDNTLIAINKFYISSVIESLDIKKSYNNMINYYNSNYSTFFQNITSDLKVIQSKQICISKVQLNTKNIYPKGFIGTFISTEMFHNSILEIGLGKYNYIGGGKIEIKD